MIQSLDNVYIAVIGLGYVGLPLAIEFGKKFDVVGFDINAARVDELSKCEDRTREANLSDLRQAIDLKLSGKNIGLSFSSKQADLSTSNVFIVTVPTPIDSFNNPDLSPLLKASKTVGEVLKKGDIVIYESTVYPGCTEEDCVPVLEQSSGLISISFAAIRPSVSIREIR
jgi:UDP-N-acetyl-D-galactosamine dehydrogenase